jgi:class 3 adenylate cyclase
MRTFSYFWDWDLDASPETLWPYVADTNRFNRDTGVPAVERLGVGRAGRRRLRLRRFGIDVEWEEEPFEWVRPSRFGVVRQYRRGPLEEMRVDVSLEPRDAGGTLLRYEVLATTRGLLGLVAVPIQIGRISRRRFERTMRAYDRLALDRVELPASEKSHLAPGGRARLTAAVETLTAGGADRTLVAKLADAIDHLDDEEVARMRPYALARAWGAERRAVLELCLWATRAKLLDFRWELLCPLCRGPGATASSLSTLDQNVHCDSCGIDYNVAFDRSVELTFRPTPAIRAVDDRTYCVGGPEVTPHIVVQQLLAPGEERIVEPALEPGSYRLRSSDGTRSDVLVETARPRLVLENASSEEQLIVLERTAWRDDATTAAEVTALQMFRDLFADEALRPGEPIEVGSLAVLFTDLRDSTRFYREVGDAPAFGTVAAHLDVLRDAVAREGGTVVKTMGDAIMAVFTRPAPALRAALAGQSELAARQPPLVLKAGIHYGPCIAVTQNDRLDYFGSTVNIAARLVALSSGEDVVVSDAVARDPELTELAALAERSSASIKGFEDEIEVVRVAARVLATT